MKQVETTGKHLGVVFGILSAIFVASYITANKLIFRSYDIDAIEYSLIFAMSGAVFAFISLIFQWNKDNTRLVLEHRMPLLGVSIIGSTAVILFTIGQQYTTTVNASLLATSTIVTTALFSHKFLKERHGRYEYLWMVVLFIGLYIGVIGFHPLSLNSGDLIVLASVVFFGCSNAYSRVVMKRMGSSRLVPDMRLAIGGLLTLFISFFVIRDLGLIISFLPLALIAGLFYWLCMKSFAKAIYLINANNAIVLNNSQIFFTSLAGVVILSEAYSLNKFLGSVIAIIAIYFIAAKK